MEDFSGDILPIFAIFSAIFLPIIVCGYLLILGIKARSKERLELIKQGIIPSSQPKAAPYKYTSLRNGFLCIGLALGIIVGIIIDNFIIFKDDIGFLVITASTLLFLGLSYVAFYLIIRNKNLEE